MGQKEPKNNGIEWTSAMKSFFPPVFSRWNTTKFHMSVFLAKVLRVRQRKKIPWALSRESWGKEGEEHKTGGGDGKRRKREKGGQFIHVCAAQTVDNGTEVDGRPTALLMEQLKCGLTAHWRSHTTTPENRHALKTLKWSFSDSYRSDTFLYFGWRQKSYWLWRSVLGNTWSQNVPSRQTWRTWLIWPYSYYENFLALKLFVGCVSTYFHMYMFSLTKSPDIYQKLVEYKNRWLLTQLIWRY